MIFFLQSNYQGLTLIVFTAPKKSSTRLEGFFEKLALKNFANFPAKHLYQSLFFNEVAGFQPATLLQQAQVFFFKLCEIF